MVSPDIIRLSPNVNSAPMPGTTRTVIIHCTRSGVSMNPSEFEGTLSYMATPGTTSSHWVISRDGVKARVVYDHQQAWHAGGDNDNCWGIENEQGVEADGFTPEQLEALLEVCAGYCLDYGVPVVHCDDSREPGFIGHEETLQGQSYGKSDPGEYFDWDWFIEALEARMAFIAGDANGGLEKRGKQVILWNEGVEVFAWGGPDDGDTPGQMAKNFGGVWRWLLRDEDDWALWGPKGD